MATSIFLAGHRGMVGSAILRVLSNDPNVSLILASRSELDLADTAAVDAFMQFHKPDQVYLAAAKVGGIHANNTYPVEFLADNLIIQSNVIQSAYRADVQKLLFLGSSCIYPKFAEQPISEDSLLTGILEPTNEPYAIAKISGIKMCESYNRQHGCDFRSVMPTNLYGPGDNYHPDDSHVIPGLIRRFHDAKVNKLDSVEIWGTGKALREFLHVEDMARACVLIMNIEKKIFNKSVSSRCSHVNVGSNSEISILDLADLIAQVVGYQGKINFNSDMPDGMMRKLLNSSLINSLGWKAEIDLERGLHSTYGDFKKLN
jgi:GDP-L-fucose synthase